MCLKHNYILYNRAHCSTLFSASYVDSFLNKAIDFGVSLGVECQSYCSDPGFYDQN